MKAFFPKLSIEADFPDGMVTWVPFVDDNGTVGYQVHRAEAIEPTVVYLYLVPSAGGEEGAADVFLYIGTAGRADEDEPAHWYEPFEPADGSP